MTPRELQRRICDFDDGGTPGWRARHGRVIRGQWSFWRLMAGRRWTRWNELERLMYCAAFPFILAAGFVFGAAVVLTLLAILGVF